MIFLPFIIFLCIFIPFNTNAYDEKAETNILLNSLPYTRREIIASRYLGAILYMILSIGIASLALAAFNKPFSFSDIAIGSGLFLLFAAFTFPLFHLLKSGYITTVVLISFLLLTYLAGPIVSYVNENLTVITDFIFSLSIQTLYVGAAAVIMTFYAVSCGVTTIIYQRKAF